MTDAALSLQDAGDVRQAKRQGFWSMSGRQFLRHRGGMIGAVVLGIVVLTALFAPLVATHDPYFINRIDRLQGPSADHWLGTDEFGRDLFSRIVHGARTSLTVAALAIALATLIGAPAGIVAGYLGGWTDSVIMRVMDIIFAFPAILLALGITAILGPSLRNAAIALGFVFAPSFARIIRGPILAAKHLEYVDAGRVIGAGWARIMLRHLLPNVVSPLIVTATVTFSFALLAEAALSFLGLGAQPPTPSWGVMLSDGRRFMESAPSLAIFPGLAVMLTVLASNLLGDALRDVLDPRMRGYRDSASPNGQ
jgi:peptide/nickel transport system permease protein